MATKHLARFMVDLGPPLGCQEGDNIWDAAKIAVHFKLKAYDFKKL